MIRKSAQFGFTGHLPYKETLPRPRKVADKLNAEKEAQRG